jgi:hypothetical protein
LRWIGFSKNSKKQCHFDERVDGQHRGEEKSSSRDERTVEDFSSLAKTHPPQLVEMTPNLRDYLLFPVMKFLNFRAILFAF